MLYSSWWLLLCRGCGVATHPRIYLTSLCPGSRKVRPRTRTLLAHTIISKISQELAQEPAGRDCHTGFRGGGKVLLCVCADVCLLPARECSLAAIRHLLCVSTAWYVAICLLPAHRRSLAAVRQPLACRVSEL